MTAKEWLLRARRMDRRIGALKETKQTAFDRATSATAVPKETPGCGGAQESKSERYAVLSAEIDEQIEELNQVRTEILQAIREIQDSTLATLILEYYVNGKTWEEVAVSVGYSYSHVVHKLHPRALNSVKKSIEVHKGVLL